MSKHKLNGALAALVPTFGSTLSMDDLNRLRKPKKTELKDWQRTLPYFEQLITAKEDGFRRFMSSVIAFHSVEGSVEKDEGRAAMMMRELALSKNDQVVGKWQLQRIAIALRKNAKEFGMGRQQRLQEAKAKLLAPKLADFSDGTPTEQ